MHLRRDCHKYQNRSVSVDSERSSRVHADRYYIQVVITKKKLRTLFYSADIYIVTVYMYGQEQTLWNCHRLAPTRTDTSFQTFKQVPQNLLLRSDCRKCESINSTPNRLAPLSALWPGNSTHKLRGEGSSHQWQVMASGPKYAQVRASCK